MTSPTHEILTALRAHRDETRETARLTAVALAALREEHAETRRLILEAVDGMAEKTRRHAAILQTHDAEIARARRAIGLATAAVFVGRRGPWAAALVATLAAALAWAR
jgi:hypothetical protein